MQYRNPWLVQLFLLLGFYLGSTAMINAQDFPLSNQYHILIPAHADTICIDSLSLIPTSIIVTDRQKATILDSTYYQLHGNCIVFQQPIPFEKKDSLWLTYRTFPIDLHKRFQWVDSSQIGSKIEELDIAFDLAQEKSTSVLPNLKGLDYQGSFARGFTLGNNQSLVLNSSFNLQMAGKIANDITIKAAITDENIPIQPEGNTQELREFDKIFIQLSKGGTSLTAGDYELKSRNSYFLNYYKKLQGVTAETSIKTGDESSLSIRGSVAIPKGQFARNIITPTEGNQGPYSLQGNNGELFLIIQSATERIYIDGRVLKRGIDEDYIIDYNRGVITFTPKNLITKDIRIIAEFEYTDQQFQRSLLTADLEWSHKNWKTYFNFITNQDSKLTGGARDIPTEQKLILAQAGDDLSQAYTSGIDTIDTFSPELITYEIVDSLGYSNILRYSTDKTKTLVTARFSTIGDNQGNYIISSTAANGRVYEWVAPINGVLQGSYEPITPLVAPEQHQVFVMGTQAKIRKNLYLQTEVSLSKKDINRFSDLDKKNDTGLSGRINLTHRLPFGKKIKHPILETIASYEWVESNYRSFNPFRNAEFARDWNINTTPSSSNELLPNISTNLQLPDIGNIKYSFSGYTQIGNYKGQKHGLDFQLNKGIFRWITNANILSSTSSVERTSYLRPKSNLSISFLKKLGKEPGRIGFIYEQEDNQRFTQTINNQSDTLSSLSRRFDFYKAYLDFPSNDKFSSGFFISQRKDFAPAIAVNPTLHDKFLQSTEAIDVAWKGRWTSSKSSRLNWQFTRRQLDISQKLLTVQEEQNTWLGKLDYYFKLKKGLLSSSTTYELGSGQTPKLEYNYLRVDPGQGSYTWVDRNTDSIPQLNEFEIAPFADQADYLRVSIVTNEFVATNNIRFNQSIRLNPKRILANKKGILKVFSKLSTINSLRLYRRLKAQPNIEAWNPFVEIIDSSLVTTESSITNTLFWNKGDPKLEGQLGQKSNQNKSLLTSGGESRKQEIYFARLRYRINRSINIELQGEQGIRQQSAELFEQRNFNIKNEKGEVSLTHIYDSRLRNIVSYTYNQKQNTLGEDRLFSHELKWAFTLTGKQKALSTQKPIRLRADLSLVKIDFYGTTGSSVGFTMLEGLQPGQNLLWSLTLDKQLTKSVIISLLYNGRQTGENNKPIHTGSMQARALF